MRQFALCASLVWAVGGFVPAASAEGIGLYLWELGEQSIIDPGQLTDGPVTVTLDVTNVPHVAGLLEKHVTLEVIETDSQSITVISRSDDSIRERPGPETSAPSFIIDYDEPAITVLLEKLDREASATPTPEALRVFVYEHIRDKTNLRGYDIASKVAKTGAGDCTEHAFLLTALARAKGYPARVVVGILVSAGDETAQSFGHAWTEIHDGKTWQRFDATLHENRESGQWLRYLPLMPLVNEGPGYTMGLVELASVLPGSVRLAGAAVSRE